MLFYNNLLSVFLLNTTLSGSPSPTHRQVLAHGDAQSIPFQGCIVHFFLIVIFGRLEQCFSEQGGHDCVTGKVPAINRQLSFFCTIYGCVLRENLLAHAHTHTHIYTQQWLDAHTTHSQSCFLSFGLGGR